MRVDQRRIVRLLVVIVVLAFSALAASGYFGAGAATAAVTPKAEISINPSAKPLTVVFAARSVNFPTPVVSYKWSFGDGTSATTSSHTVAHTYAKASLFSASVSITDTYADKATARGTLDLLPCPVGIKQCTEHLDKAGTVQVLQASGPVNPNARAGLDLFVDPFEIAGCEPEVATAVAITDSGFSGNLTILLKYTTSHVDQAKTTCFASLVPFTDSAGRSVTSGALPTCQPAGPKAPCVESLDVSGTTVTKNILIPPGDPKVGAP